MFWNISNFQIIGSFYDKKIYTFHIYLGMKILKMGRNIIFLFDV